MIAINDTNRELLARTIAARRGWTWDRKGEQGAIERLKCYEIVDEVIGAAIAADPAARHDLPIS
jgi:hypothetical protein